MPQVGDVVELLTRRSSDEGWLFVRHAGRSGLVPIAFLVLESAAAAPPAAPPTAAPAAAAPLAAPPAAPAAAPSDAPTAAPSGAPDQLSTPRAGLRKLWGGGAKVGLPQLAPGGAGADAAAPAALAAPSAPAPNTAPLGTSGSSTNVPRCTSSFGRMLRKVSSFERKKEKPPSLRSGSQSARGRASGGEVVGSAAQCD